MRRTTVRQTPWYDRPFPFQSAISLTLLRPQSMMTCPCLRKHRSRLDLEHHLQVMSNVSGFGIDDLHIHTVRNPVQESCGIDPTGVPSGFLSLMKKKYRSRVDVKHVILLGRLSDCRPTYLSVSCSTLAAFPWMFSAAFFSATSSSSFKDSSNCASTTERSSIERYISRFQSTVVCETQCSP